MRTRIMYLAIALGITTQAVASDVENFGDYVPSMSYNPSFWTQNGDSFDQSKEMVYRKILIVDMDALVQQAPHLQHIDDLQLNLARDDPRFNAMLFPDERADTRQLKAVEDALISMGNLSPSDPNYVPEYAVTAIKLGNKTSSLYGHLLNVHKRSSNMGVIGFSKAPYSKRKQLMAVWNNLGITMNAFNKKNPNYNMLNTSSQFSQKVLPDAGCEQGIYFMNGYSPEDAMRYIWSRLQIQYTYVRGTAPSLSTIHLSRDMTLYKIRGKGDYHVYYQGAKHFLRHTFNHRTFFVQRLPLSFQKFTDHYRVMQKLQAHFFTPKHPIIILSRSSDLPKVETKTEPEVVVEAKSLPKTDVVSIQETQIQSPVDGDDSLDIQALIQSYAPPLSDDDDDQEEDLAMQLSLLKAQMRALGVPH